MKLSVSLILGSLVLLGSAQAIAQQLQFCVYNKHGQRQGGCYIDKKACENVAANYNKTNGSMGLFCQPEKK